MILMPISITSVSRDTHYARCVYLTCIYMYTHTHRVRYTCTHTRRVCHTPSWRNSPSLHAGYRVCRVGGNGGEGRGIVGGEGGGHTMPEKAIIARRPFFSSANSRRERSAPLPRPRGSNPKSPGLRFEPYFFIFAGGRVAQQSQCVECCSTSSVLASLLHHHTLYL